MTNQIGLSMIAIPNTSTTSLERPGALRCKEYPKQYPIHKETIPKNPENKNAPSINIFSKLLG